MRWHFLTQPSRWFETSVACWEGQLEHHGWLVNTDLSWGLTSYTRYLHSFRQLNVLIAWSHGQLWGTEKGALSLLLGLASF